MLANTASPRVTEALARAQQHWQEKHQSATGGEPLPSSFTIAMSREAGTYGAAIAREVGNRLNWPVYDNELLQRIAEDLGVRKVLFEKIDERQPGWLEESLSGLFSGVAVNEASYFRHLMETLLSLSKIGSCVIVGRGANFALPAAATLRVRVVAPFEHRVAAVAREHGIAHDKAAERVRGTDSDRNRYVKNHFRVDLADPANYDLTLNAERFTTAECADLVIAALEKLRKKTAASS